jgi:hypothetical protein
MSENLWAEVDIEHWQSVPHISGRVASEDDVEQGRAVFYLGNPDEIGAHSYDQISLPHCATLADEVSGERIPVLVIQVEKAEDRIYVGYRFLGGGNGVCLLSELELVDGPDDRFVRDQEKTISPI